jgi:hypothetical protein
VYRVIAVVKLSIFAVVLCFVQLLGVSKQIAVVRLDAKPWAMVGTNEQSFKIFIMEGVVIVHQTITT